MGYQSPHSYDRIIAVAGGGSKSIEAGAFGGSDGPASCEFDTSVKSDEVLLSFLKMGQKRASAYFWFRSFELFD